jgi:hypothetical protein
VAAVLVHIDLDGERPDASSLVALAAGRAVASSWGATLYAAVIAHAAVPRGLDGAPPPGATSSVPGDPRAIEAVRAALAGAGADKIVVALTDAPIAPLWGAVGAAWQGVLDRLRPRLVLFGADAPSAVELGPRTGARIGARLFARGCAVGIDQVELRDRGGSYLRMTDSGAAVALVGAAPRLALHGDDDIDVLVLTSPGGADPRIEVAGSAPAAVGHLAGPIIAIGDAAARNPEIATATRRLAHLLGAQIVGSANAATAGVVAAGAVIDRASALAPELCVAIGAPAIDLAGASSVVRIGSSGHKGADAALPGPIAANLAELVRSLEGR